MTGLLGRRRGGPGRPATGTGPSPVPRQRGGRHRARRPPIDDPDPGSLGKAARSGTRWSVLQFGAARFTTFLVFVVLARLLAPADFGVVAIATVFIALLQLLVEGGFSQALIQRPTLEHGHVDTAFWTSVGMSLILAGGLSLAAGPIAGLYGEPTLALILPLLSIGLVLGALGSTQTAQLRRAMRFAPLGVRAIVSNIVAGLVSVSAALLGAGVFALVAQFIVLNAVQTALLWSTTGHRPGLAVSRRHFADIFSFSRHTLGNQLLNFSTKRSDDFLIGIILGPVALGLYSVGYRLLTSILDVIVPTLLGVALPVFSKLQSDPARLRSAYTRVLTLAAAVAFPGFLFFTIAADDAVLVVFGAQWAAAAPIMAVLALFGALQATITITESCLTGIGKPQVVFRNRLVATVVQVVAFVVAAQFGIVWVAWALVIRTYLLAPLPIWSLVRAGVIDGRGWLRTSVTPLACTAVMLGAVALVRFGLAEADAAARLGAMVLVALLSYVGSLAAVDRQLLLELVGIFALRRGAKRAGKSSSAKSSSNPARPMNVRPTDAELAN